MKTIIIASMFCMDNFLPILLVVLGAGLLGWLLKKYTGGGSSSANNEWESKYNAITAVCRVFKPPPGAAQRPLAAVL